MIKEDANYLISDISEKDRLIRLQYNLERENHLAREENSIRKIDELFKISLIMVYYFL